ncbi:MAG: hypothetical protein K6T85_15200 [Gorillibacterium sp.]|nr:hypothetical protein [Gorillibacterium sp.]
MIRKVRDMPDMPSPYVMRDWKRVSIQYDQIVFDFEAKGDLFPLIWWDKSHHNIDRDTFGLPSYLGMKREGDRHEAINTASAVLGATLAGVDKSNQNGHNWVEMLEAYYNTDNDEELFLNRTSLKAGTTFWYEIYPHVLLYSLAYYYPQVGRLEDIMLQTADKWLLVCQALKDPLTAIPDFNHLSFDFDLMQPVDNGRWKEPEAAAGIAWLEYMAYIRFGGSERLDAVDGCLRFMTLREGNTFYEILQPYGAYIAARMNAEQGTAYDVDKLINWVFDGDSECRPGWGVVTERWGEYDCHGLCGSLTDWGQRWDEPHDDTFKEFDPKRSGYAFAANTFSLAATLVPLVRYDSRYTRAIGKWMLNAANAARLFYPGSLPAKQQSCAFFDGGEEDVFAYEGLRKWWDHQSPYATGDPIRYSWGAIDIGLYGSSHVGIFGGIIATTEVEGILRLDCLRTDYYRSEAYPTYLYYNPHPEEHWITLETGTTESIRIYNVVTHTFLSEEQFVNGSILLPPSGAVLAVLVPANGKEITTGSKRLINDIIVDYNIEV